MKPKKPLRKVSKSRERMLNSEIGNGFLKFNSTIRRESCNATTAVSNYRAKTAVNNIFSRSDSTSVLQEQLKTNLSRSVFAEKTLSASFGKQRKPVKKQSERQNLRLQKLAAIRMKWWTQSEATGEKLVCQICDEPIQNFTDLASDHIQPGSAKSDCETNLQPSHRQCNICKGSIRNFKIVRGDHNWLLMHGLL
jgi:hypothetical protein